MDGAIVEPGPTNAQPNPQRRIRPSEEEMRVRLEIAKGITQLFKLERYVYVSCCGVAVVLLLTNAGMLIVKGGIDYTGLGLLFGASGFITYSIGRLIYMWNKVVDLILSEVAGPGEN